LPDQIESLVAHFEQFLPLTPEEKKLVEQKTSRRQLKKKQMILQEGLVCRHYTFVAKGCLRLYGIDKKGVEHNIQFAAENDWISDIGSFHSGKSSRLFIEAVETSVILQVEKYDLYLLYESIPKLDRIFKVIIENKFVELQNRVLQNISSTAMERYMEFLEQYSQLALRLPNTQIASYLGITPEFLSKMRGARR